MRTTDLGNRIQARLDALGINSFEASRRAGFNRGYIRDLLEGRKKNVLSASLPRIASALECDVEYLLGQQDEPSLHETTTPPAGFLPYGGTIEAGAWREPQIVRATRLPQGPDPRYPADAQSVWRVVGDGADLLDIHHMDIVIVVAMTAADARSGGHCRHDDVVVLRRTTESGLTETSIRQVEQRQDGYWLHLRSSSTHAKIIRCPCCDDAAAQDEHTELVGIVARAIHVFGPAH